MGLLAILVLIVWLFVAFTRPQRVEIFKRDGMQCQGCGAKWDDGIMLECHHVNPLNCGGENSVSNGKLLCRDCHRKAHIRLSQIAKTKEQRNANANAARMIESVIRKKGRKRYGY